MKTTTVNIGNLVASVERREIRLPEIQRGYVWKPPQVAGLFDSLYRGYPSGSLLLWETDQLVEERPVDVLGPNEAPMARPQYLLDGQQRLTSLHRVFTGHPKAQLMFHVVNERFQIASAAAKKDGRWISVQPLLNGELDTFALVSELQERYGNLDQSKVHENLQRVKSITHYPYYVEILQNLDYDEVTEIFVRVNSRGRALKTHDLALATLSARWPGTVARFRGQAEQLEGLGYGHLDEAFLIRLLAGIASENTRLNGLPRTPLERIEQGWDQLQRGVTHLLNILQNNVGIVTSQLVGSVTALIPMAAYLGTRQDTSLSAEEVNSLVYWMFAANLSLRFSAGKETKLSEDLAAIHSDAPLERLLRNSGLLGQRLAVTEEALVGRTMTSPYFLLSYLAAKRRGARDWFYGVEIGTNLGDSYALEYHHIHPRATLKSQHQRAEINDLSNLAFISAKANRKIGARSPRDYFPEVGEAELKAHMVPRDERLRGSEAYPEFLAERRRLLAQDMTGLLDSFQPAGDRTMPIKEDSAAGDHLRLRFFGDPAHGDWHMRAVFSVRARMAEWHGHTTLFELKRFFGDISNGFGAQLDLGGATSTAAPGEENVTVLVGPLQVVGDVDEWLRVIDRELHEGNADADAEEPAQSPPWAKERTAFPILDAE